MESVNISLFHYQRSNIHLFFVLFFCHFVQSKSSKGAKADNGGTPTGHPTRGFLTITSGLNPHGDQIITVKILKIQSCKKFAVNNTLKFQQGGFTVE